MSASPEARAVEEDGASRRRRSASSASARAVACCSRESPPCGGGGDAWAPVVAQQRQVARRLRERGEQRREVAVIERLAQPLVGGCDRGGGTGDGHAHLRERPRVIRTHAT